jgi:cardiolipin synthase
MTGPVLTIPNLISLIRILAVPVFLWMLFGLDEPGWAGFLLGWIGATDWIDGFLARRLGQVSEIGKFLDPLADRLAIVAAVIGGWVAGVLPWPFALALVVREALIAGGALVLAARTGARLEVRQTGKAATMGLFLAIPSFFIYAGTDQAIWAWLAWGLGIPSLILYYAVGVLYFGDIRRLASDDPPAPPVSSP